MLARFVRGLSLGLCLIPQLTHADVEHLGTFVWEREESFFGGLSGLEIAANGIDFLAIGDSAQLLRGTFERAEGRITDARIPWIGALKGSGGAPLFQTGNKQTTDSEGLAGGPDGPFYVSFEQSPRVWRYDSLDGPAIPLPYYENLTHWRGNRSFEALAVDQDGTLYTIPEGRRSRLKRFPVYRFDGAVWDRPFWVPARDWFYPVGADFGPDGRLYLLERRHHGFLRFSSRVRSFLISGDEMLDEQEVLRTQPGQFDNLEGIALWTDNAGATRITLISDDNYLALQETQIVEFRLTE